MNNNYFYLELDTTGPDISIYAPYDEMEGAILYFSIVASSPVNPGVYICYIENPQGVQTPISLALLPDGMTYTASFHLPLSVTGVFTIYAQVVDDVNNPSPLVSHSVLIRARSLCVCDIALEQCRNTIDVCSQNTIIVIKERKQILEIEESRSSLCVQEKKSLLSLERSE